MRIASGIAAQEQRLLKREISRLLFLWHMPADTLCVVANVAAILSSRAERVNPVTAAHVPIMESNTMTAFRDPTEYVLAKEQLR